MSGNEFGVIYAVAAATTTTADTATSPKPTTTTTKAPPATTSTTTKAPTTTAPSPPPSTNTPTSTAVTSLSSPVASTVISSVPPTSSSLPITTSSSVIPSTNIIFVSASSSIPSITPTSAAVFSEPSNNHTNLIGPIVGAVGGAALLLGIGVLFFRRQRHKREENDADRTFSDYLETSAAAMRSPVKPQWTTDHDNYNGRNSTSMRSPASIAAGLYQQPSPRMMPAVGTAGAMAAGQQIWGSSGSPSPENTLVGSPEQHAGYNRYSGNYNHSQYYSQPEYPASQAYYQYRPDPYQYYTGHQPYYDPETEQYVYPAEMSSGQDQTIASENLSHGQPPNTYEPQSPRTDYRQSPLPAIPQPNSQSMISSVDEPRFPVDNPALQNTQMRDISHQATKGSAPPRNI